MAEHIWSVLCESSAVDKYSNQVSLFSVIEGLNLVFNEQAPSASGDVSVGVHMRLVSYWIRSRPGKAERAELRMSLELPNGRIIAGQQPIAIDLDHAPRARTLSQLGSIRYAGPGEYAMIVDYRNAPSGRWKRAARLPFEIAVHSAEALGAIVHDTPAVAEK